MQLRRSSIPHCSSNAFAHCSALGTALPIAMSASSGGNSGLKAGLFGRRSRHRWTLCTLFSLSHIEDVSSRHAAAQCHSLSSAALSLRCRIDLASKEIPLSSTFGQCSGAHSLVRRDGGHRSSYQTSENLVHTCAEESSFSS